MAESGEEDMHRRSLQDIEGRAIQNFKVREERVPDGRLRLVVTNLLGVTITCIEGRDKAEVEHHLRDMGYERIPSYVAFEIDAAATGQ